MIEPLNPEKTWVNNMNQQIEYFPEREIKIIVSKIDELVAQINKNTEAIEKISKALDALLSADKYHSVDINELVKDQPSQAVCAKNAQTKEQKNGNDGISSTG